MADLVIDRLTAIEERHRGTFGGADVAVMLAAYEAAVRAADGAQSRRGTGMPPALRSALDTFGHELLDAAAAIDD